MNKLTKDQLSEINQEIISDIKMGVYNDFPVARKELDSTRQRVEKSIHIVNYNLSQQDVNVLKFYNYI